MSEPIKLKPAHTYPTEYIKSQYQIDLTCDCHDHIHGRGDRTGVALYENWPVYRVRSWAHPEYNDWLMALSPNGLIERRRPTPEAQPC
jgi:hypothetical protein